MMIGSTMKLFVGGPVQSNDGWDKWSLIRGGIALASDDERREMKGHCLAFLGEANEAMKFRARTGSLSLQTPEEKWQIKDTVQTLVEVEAYEQNGGWWFKFRRRHQLLNQVYLG
jgi:hypothetical protein